MDLYENMMRMPWFVRRINTKRYALLAKPWQVFPATGGQEARPTAEQQTVRDFVSAAARDAGVGRDAPGLSADTVSDDVGVYRGFRWPRWVWRLEESGPFAGKFCWRRSRQSRRCRSGSKVDDYLNVQCDHDWTAGGKVVTVPRGKCVLYVDNPRDEMPYAIRICGRVQHGGRKDVLAAVLDLCLQKYGMPMVFARCRAAGDQPGRRRWII